MSPANLCCKETVPWFLLQISSFQKCNWSTINWSLEIKKKFQELLADIYEIFLHTFVNKKLFVATHWCPKSSIIIHKNPLLMKIIPYIEENCSAGHFYLLRKFVIWMHFEALNICVLCRWIPIDKVDIVYSNTWV